MPTERTAFNGFLHELICVALCGSLCAADTDEAMADGEVVRTASYSSAVISPIESSARADVVEDAAAPTDAFEVAAADGDDFGCVIRKSAPLPPHPHTERVCTAAP